MDPEKEKRFRFQMQYEQEQAEAQQQAPQQLGVMDTMGALSDMAPWNVARKYTTDLAGENIAEAGGQMGYPEAGAVAGTAVQMVPDILASMQPPKALGTFRGTAENFGRRALGYNKGLIKKAGGVPKANKVAGKMLDEGVITAGASPETMLDRAETIGEQAGKRIGETLSSVDEPLLTTRGLRKDVSNQLSPDRKGGEYNRLRGYVADIQRTIKAHAPPSKTVQKLEVEPGGLLKMNKVRQRPPDELSFESAQELKQTLKGPAQFGKLADGERAEMFRRAYGIVRESIDTGLDKAVQSGLIQAEKAAQFVKDKATYGASEQAITALKDKLAGEAANNIISLRGTIAGAGAAASGNVAGTLGSLGAWEVLRRRGDATAAAALNSLSKTRGVNSFNNAVLTEFVDRFVNNRRN